MNIQFLWTLWRIWRRNLEDYKFDRYRYFNFLLYNNHISIVITNNYI